ncbi:hypothetical protein EUX98_g1152 [Antrodiella citrinella]|uniref:Uncharacterized protein n=1 Tax=Antrodiella citrinella TaxID=2447956 RepID=A0A4S4N297_9APHY|nr:hypothetical protein EUX98_g1152 [Antrodiella citrinella]
MGKAKKTRKFATVKRLLNPNDIRLKENQAKQQKKEEEVKAKAVRRVYVVLPCAEGIRLPTDLHSLPAVS